MISTAARRLWLFVFVLGACFVALEIRLFHLQVVKRPALGKRADDLHRTVERLLAARGRIVDRNGNPLAESIPAVDLYSDSRHTTGHRDAIAERIESILGAQSPGGEADLGVRALLERDGYRRLLSRPVWDGERVQALWQSKRDKQLPGIDLSRSWMRRYAEGALGAAIVGYVDAEGKGSAGLELAFDGYLRGTEGRRMFVRDGARNAMFDAGCEVVAPTAGADVRLTLDVVLQLFAEDALDETVAQFRPNWAVAVVIDPQTGEILALANRPTFDPNHYANYPLEQHQNRASSAQYTPGSAFKPFVMAAAFEAGCVNLGERIDCENGAHSFDNRIVHDSHPHGILTPTEIISDSSNIGMSKIMMRMVPADSAPAAQAAAFRRLHQLFADLGFGTKPDLGLPGEASGVLRPVASWSRKYTAVSMAFGHELAVTPVQMAAAFSVFATGGVFHPPLLVDAVIGPDGRVLEQRDRPERRVFSERAAEKMREMLIAVVDDGTGKSAMVAGYRVAGKTSTAEYEADKSRHTASFLGFAPADDPRLLVAIIVDQPRGQHMGGQVAAPPAGQILARGLDYLRVPPDRVVTKSAATGIAREPR